jgi:arylsulfatase A-like enzyme
MATEKPNLLLIMADNVGCFDVGAYHRGIMGTRTPNIDRVAEEGALLTDNYAQASCTAGRAAFITGQIPLRTGLTTVGLPGAKQGLQPEDPTLAELLKPQGYMTAQHGKNHLGDRNEFLPTVHGFDEFYGNLYHLNAEEEPEQPDYPKDNPLFEKLFAPRGVLECKATGVDDATEDERFGRVGKQTIQDTGPLTRKRMETVEEDLLSHSTNFIHRAHDADNPFLLWHDTTRMHVWTRLSERWRDKTGLGVYADGMQELDWVVGELLGDLDDLGIAENTVVVFATDNGAEKFTWPDGGTSPFRGEKGLGWEGGFRAPLLIRWPARIPVGRVLNGITSLEDIVPTILAAVGVPDIKEQLLTGYDADEKHFKVHLDGYNQLPYLSGETDESPRHEFFHYGEHDLFAIRYNNWKVHFQTKDDWFAGAPVKATVPRPVNPARGSLRAAHGGTRLPGLRRGQALDPDAAAAIVQQHAATFKEFPPRQAPPDFNPQAMVESVIHAAATRQGN